MEQGEPRRLFKTISLEERLAASEYNKLPDSNPTSNPPQGSPQVNESETPQDKQTQSPEVNLSSTPQDKQTQSPEVGSIPLSNEAQGSPEVQGIPTSQNKDSDDINLPKSQLTQPKEGIVLKSALDIPDKDAIILKTLADSPQAQIPPPSPFDTTPLLNSSRPTGQTQFASSISLEDRLDQSSVTTLRDRLEQSDVTSTRHLPQYFLTDLYTGYLVIAPFITLKIEDTQDIGQVPLAIASNTILEGLLNFIELDNPNGNQEPSSEQSVLVSQGTFISNDIPQSLSITEEPLSENTILVAQGTFISNNVANSFSEVVDAIPTAQIDQGTVDLPVFNVAVVQGEDIDIPEPPGEITIASLQGMVIDNNAIDGSAITLDLIAYETDRALAFGSPQVKHGTTVLVLTEFLASKEASVNTPLAFHGSTEINVEPFTPVLESSPIQALAVQRYLESRTAAINSPIQVHGAVVPTPVQIDPAAIETQGVAVQPNPPGEILANIPLPPEIQGVGGFTYNDGNPTGFSGIIGQADFVNAPTTPYTPGGSNTSGVSAAPLGTNNISRSKIPGQEDTNNHKDFIKIKITSVRDNKTIQLKSFLNSYSDGMTANWSDIQYIGRQDTLKYFTGATRAISFAVSMPAFNKDEQQIMMKKLEQVISMTSVAGFEPGAKYLTAPLCKLRVGGLIDAYVAFGSVKWEFDPAEASFDLDTELPMMFKVSFDGAVLSTNKGKLLNAADGGYFKETYI
jgi:hypothetical protein